MLDLKGYGWMLWDGVQITLAVAVCAMALALALGLVGTTGKLAHFFNEPATTEIYTTVIRGVPELLLILIVYYGAPTLIQDTAEKFGYDIIIDINPFIAGSITIGFIYSAFATEVFRGAYLAVPPGPARGGPRHWDEPAAGRPAGAAAPDVALRVAGPG